METTLAAFVDDFIATKQAEGLSVKTIAWYRWILTRFTAAIGNPPLSQLSLADAREFVASLQGRTTRYDDHPPARAHPRSESGLGLGQLWRSIGPAFLGKAGGLKGTTPFSLLTNPSSSR
jgi:hypothetical protein